AWNAVGAPALGSVLEIRADLELGTERVLLLVRVALRAVRVWVNSADFFLRILARPAELELLKTMVPVAPFEMLAFPALLLSKKRRLPLLVTLELPAELKPLKFRMLLLVMPELPAELKPLKLRMLLLVMLELPAELNPSN